MKTFDVLEWLRRIRDEHHAEQRGATVEQKIAQTQAQAKAFRDSRKAAPPHQ